MSASHITFSACKHNLKHHTGNPRFPYKNKKLHSPHPKCNPNVNKIKIRPHSQNPEKNNKTIIILKNNPFSFSTALQSLSFEHCERTYDARPPGCTVLESLNRRRGGGAPAAEPEPWRTSELIAP